MPNSRISIWLLRLRHFQKQRQGSTAIEFAILAAPFLMLLFMIFEVALVHFGAFSLDNAAEQAGRLIRTGQAQSGGFDAGEFKEAVCDHLAGPLACTDKLKLDVKSFPTFSAVTMTEALNEEGEPQEDLSFQPGNGSEVVVVRVFYEWELIGKLPNWVPGFGLGNMSNGNRMLVSTAVFRNEPFN